MEMYSLTNLKEALVYVLEGLYDAECRLYLALHNYTFKTASPALQEKVDKYVEQSKSKAQQIETIFKLLEQQTKGHENKVINMLIDECLLMNTHIYFKEVHDAMLIAKLQEIIHHKTAGYGTAHAFAKELHMSDIYYLLLEMLAHEKETDYNLTQMATENINAKAIEIVSDTLDPF